MFGVIEMQISSIDAYYYYKYIIQKLYSKAFLVIISNDKSRIKYTKENA